MSYPRSQQGFEQASARALIQETAVETHSLHISVSSTRPATNHIKHKTIPTDHFDDYGTAMADHRPPQQAYVINKALLRLMTALCAFFLTCFSVFCCSLLQAAGDFWRKVLLVPCEVGVWRLSPHGKGTHPACVAQLCKFFAECA